VGASSPTRAPRQIRRDRKERAAHQPLTAQILKRGVLADEIGAVRPARPRPRRVRLQGEEGYWPHGGKPADARYRARRSRPSGIMPSSGERSSFSWPAVSVGLAGCQREQKGITRDCPRRADQGARDAQAIAGAVRQYQATFARSRLRRDLTEAADGLGHHRGPFWRGSPLRRWVTPYQYAKQGDLNFTVTRPAARERDGGPSAVQAMPRLPLLEAAAFRGAAISCSRRWRHGGDRTHPDLARCRRRSRAS